MKTRKRPPLFTIGYEQAKSSAVLRELEKAKVEVLVDVRAVAASRRPGFSKRQLAAGLDEHGIAYLHLRALGTPKEGRLAARAGDMEKLFKIFDAHLKTPAARQELDGLSAAIRSGRRICLLCYERDAAHCHRSRLAEIMRKRAGIKVENLLAPLF